MATIDVYNLKREKVGSIDLADEVFGAEVQGAPLLRSGEGAARVARARAPQAAKNRSRGQRQHARSSTSRRAPAARATARSARRIYVGGGQGPPAASA